MSTVPSIWLNPSDKQRFGLGSLGSVTSSPIRPSKYGANESISEAVKLRRKPLELREILTDSVGI
jgi:hypothetical protein